MKKYTEYKGLDLSQTAKDVQKNWDENNIFEKSITSREGKAPFVFYEGPPSANGLPGIHHVMARSIKDIFCRYKTQKGFQVKRKAGWDTHGLPIELSVEKALGITKEDIGKKITVEQYNIECRKDVMKYTDKWEDLTKKMGYWVDMQHPYITYDNKYIESVWWLLNKLHTKGLLYKGFTIQPYSPAAGTGLSSHELNQPGCYRDVKDRTAVAQFKVKKDEKWKNALSKIGLKSDLLEDVYFLAWTTTPWTLPSNTALAIGKSIGYEIVKSFNPFNGKKEYYILAADLVGKYFSPKNKELKFGDYKVGDKNIPFEIIARGMGNEFEGINYEQLLPFSGVEIDNNSAFRVVIGDFVTTLDGTGVVHIAPTFGSDDFAVAVKNNIPPATVKRLNGLIDEPLVDLKGKFAPEVKDGIFLYGEEYVKEAYLTDAEKEAEFQHQKKVLETNGKIKELKTYLSVDDRIILKLQEEGKLFKKETYEHSYPHCWRTDKPVLYYPLDSWFIKTTDYKDRMIELNKTINWKPESTGTGRFGNWLENLNDWNLSRSRFWGIPLPIWRNSPRKWNIKKIEKCIGSIDELKSEGWYFLAHEIPLEKLHDRFKGMVVKTPLELSAIIDTLEIANDQTESAKEASSALLKLILKVSIKNGALVPVSAEYLKDLHKPYIDKVCYIEDGEIAVRENDLIDVWFDSGAMPFAQMHFPFENVQEFAKNYPADFIAEGVDQTRGWFFTLHAISAMVKEEVQEELKRHGIEASDKQFPGIAYKNVVSNGLVLDKNGQKMSKRLGNAIDPFVTIEKYGPDATRWYMITNAAPWDNLKFDIEGIGEVQRSFFGTLHNTYSFFALYANVDGFVYKEAEIPVIDRPEIDRWILSELNTLIKKVDEAYSEYEPHRAGRYIETFVDEHLSNWYVRLCRRRFWKGEYSHDKIAAYQTLYRCMEVIAQLSAPIAPYFMDRLYSDLNSITGRDKASSIHLSNFPESDTFLIDKDLEERMELAQKVSSMILSIRKKENIRVRQPLNKIRIPVLDESYKTKIEAVKDLILSEVNVKEIEFVSEADTQIVKNMKLNFKELGGLLQANMKNFQKFANENQQIIISSIEREGQFVWKMDGVGSFIILPQHIEIIPVDIPGWKVANSGQITVALDVTLTAELREEGLARELVNRIQNLRKESNLDVTDKIDVKIQRNSAINEAINNNLNYICTEILASSLELVDTLEAKIGAEIELDEQIKTLITITKLN